MSAIDNLRAMVNSTLFINDDYPLCTMPTWIGSDYVTLTVGDLCEILAALDRSDSAVCSHGELADYCEPCNLPSSTVSPTDPDDAAVYLRLIAALGDARLVLLGFEGRMNRTIREVDGRFALTSHAELKSAVSDYCELTGLGIPPNWYLTDPEPAVEILGAAQAASRLLHAYSQCVGSRISKSGAASARVVGERASRVLDALDELVAAS